MREQHPNALVATYINCNAETKAESDIIVTSSNAETVIEAFRKTDRSFLHRIKTWEDIYLRKQDAI
jgi:quinolinate synthase